MRVYKDSHPGGLRLPTVVRCNTLTATNAARTKKATNIDDGYCQLLLSWNIDYQPVVTTYADL